MGNSIVQFVIAECHDIGNQQIHNLDRGILNKINRDPRCCLHAGCRFLLNLLYIASRHAKFIDLFGKKIAMQIIGVKDRQFLCVLHISALLFYRISYCQHFQTSPLDKILHRKPDSCYPQKGTDGLDSLK